MSRSTHRVLITPAAAFWAAVFFSTFHSSTLAEPIFFGPTPYLSSADSPFDLSGLGTTMFLEDFEDGELNTPGILYADLLPFRPGPFQNVDSVDADDGVIDGSGLRGHSARSNFGVCTDGEPPNCWSSGGVTFDRDELGWLPTAVGIVWTDGWPTDGVQFAFTNSAGHTVFREDRFFLADNNFMGGTDEDRFFGVIDPNGIAAFHLEAGRGADEPGFSFEVDHLQYGLFVPEPAASAMMLFAIGAMSNFLPRSGGRRRFGGSGLFPYFRQPEKTFLTGGGRDTIGCPFTQPHLEAAPCCVLPETL